jgi:hypothetical protein
MKTTILKFFNPSDDEESKLRFKLLENRGNRVLVELICDDQQLKPTFVYLAKDLTPV